MGTYYTTGASKKDIISEIIAGWANDKNGSKCEVLTYCVRGNVLWAVHKLTKPDGEKDRFIVDAFLWFRCR